MSTPVSAPLGASMSPSPSDDARAGRDGRSGVGFTPGPWKCRKSVHGNQYRYVQIGKDETYTTLELLPADARLIAAAPDLHEALTLAIKALEEAEAILGGEYGDRYGVFCELMLSLKSQGSAALANARGATPPSQQVPTPSSNT